MADKYKKLIYDPKPWQMDALGKLNNIDYPVKLVQKAGGGGKTYLAFYYFCQNHSRDSEVVVLGKPKELDNWKKWFDDDFNANFVSKGLLNRSNFFEKHEFKSIDLLIIDEADHGLSTETSNTYKHIEKLIEISKEVIIISATLFEKDYVPSIPILQLCGFEKDDIVSNFFKTKPNVFNRYVMDIVGGSPEQKSKFETFIDSLGYIELEKIVEHKTNKVAEISEDIEKEDIERRVTKIEIDVPKVIKDYLNIINKESFNPFTNEPIVEVAAKYPLMKRVSSGVNFVDETKKQIEVFDGFKLKELDKLIKEIKGKCFIYYESQSERILLENYFVGKKLTYQMFNQDVELDDSQYTIGQYSSMSRSIDIPDLQALIFFSPTDKFKDFKQARFRVAREGSVWNVVDEYWLIPKKTVQEKMFKNLVEEKNNTPNRTGVRKVVIDEA